MESNYTLLLCKPVFPTQTETQAKPKLSFIQSFLMPTFGIILVYPYIHINTIYAEYTFDIC